ncbi:MAG: hypothetical protein GC193_12945 [Cryomorphaceae bacterium]|nr:hypothetical protein [Cryomorphaceae bacterium]
MVVLPLCTFANVGWYSWLFHAGKVTIDVGENYQKQTWRNRFDIAGPNGSFACTLTVRGLKGVKTPMHAIETIDDGWRHTLTRTLATCYSPAPFFEHYWPQLEQLLKTNTNKLADFNKLTLEWALEALDIAPNIVFSNEYIEPDAMTLDLRDAFKPSKSQIHTPPYQQVFSDRCGYIDNLSIIDLIMNLGPEAYLYLRAYRPDDV